MKLLQRTMQSKAKQSDRDTRQCCRTRDARVRHSPQALSARFSRSTFIDSSPTDMGSGPTNIRTLHCAVSPPLTRCPHTGPPALHQHCCCCHNHHDCAQLPDTPDRGISHCRGRAPRICVLVVNYPCAPLFVVLRTILAMVVARRRSGTFYQALRAPLACIFRVDDDRYRST